jgi:hypothetical protein
MAELRTETRLIADLQAHPQNYRAHPPEQISAIKASLTRLGQFRAVVVNTEDTILAGHGVVQAAQELGWTEITVHVFEGDEAEQRLVMVADNELSRKAEDDERSLMSLLREIGEDFGDLRGTGWGEEEHEQRLAELVAESELIDTIDFTPQSDQDQAGQGTAWNSVHSSDRVRLVFGVIEAALPEELYSEVHYLCEDAFDRGASYADQIALILRRGCEACASA